jgi:hypothetical protein
MCIDSVEYPIILGERVRAEWEGRRESFRRNISKDIHLIASEWSGRDESLLSTQECLLGEDIAS